jgi:protoporphyrinogen IX oxidase
MVYLYVKALHIIAVIAWMAAMLYLPRLFVYHAAATPGGELSQTFKVMERRLLWAIATPAAVVTWLSGVHIAVSGGHYHALWLQIKFALVIAMTALHVHNVIYQRAFARDANTRSTRYFRIYNEAPTLLLITIVLLATVKPF